MRIEVSDLTVTFPRRDLTALDDVSLTVEEGEQVALLGSSGSGKTTLLRTLLGAVTPTAGRVRVGPYDPFGSPEELRDLRRATGVVRQGSDLVAGLTGRTNALMGSASDWRLTDWLAVLRRSAPERYREPLEELARRHGVVECLPARVEHLSGGQRQRIGLLRALLTGPKLLLADEPTAGLDVRTGEAAVEALRGVGTVTLLVTTHDLGVARRFPRVVALRDGRLVFDGADPTDDELSSIYGAMA